MRPSVSVQVIGPVLTDFFHCLHCEQVFHQAGLGQRIHREMLDQYPEDVKQAASDLADWVISLSHRYGDSVQWKVVDPQSLEGFFLSLRYWVRRYPAFIVDGQKASVGSDREALDRILRARLDNLPEGNDAC